MGSPAVRCAFCQVLIPSGASRCDACGSALPVRSGGLARLLAGLALASAAALWLRPDSSVPALTPARPATEQRTARSYYDEGLEYKRLGWVERSRRALSMAVEMDDGEVGKMAARYMGAYLPAHPVTREAQDLNVRGFNLWHSGQAEAAKQVFRDCIARYPRFEWPYGNLGALLVSQGEVQTGIEILGQALAINPSYRNGLLHLAHAHLALGDRDTARAFYQRAIDADPSDDAVRQEARANAGAP